MERFSKFKDKIISFKITDNPEDFNNLKPTKDVELLKIYHYINNTSRFNRSTQPDYGRDFFQKESVRRALVNCDDDDIIIFSDVDEIPNPEIFETLNDLNLDENIYSLQQRMFYYFINVQKNCDWYGSRIGKYKNMKNQPFNEIRGNPALSVKIENCGWHFSFMGGRKMVESKLLAYCHNDMVYDKVLTELDNNMKNNIDPFFRDTLQEVEIDSTYPKYLLDNLNKYENLIKS
tara:strand:- start:3956 stop:4654 length:699 start_codon:yes stop_codon:yes gene_type:complete